MHFDQDSAHQLDELTRRQFALDAARCFLGVSVFSALTPFGFAADSKAPAASGKGKAKAKQIVYLMMTGAMSQLDTFDPKPKSKFQGETKAISTKVSGVQLSEHLKNIAGIADKVAILRSLNTTTADHQQARYLLETSYKPIATTKHPGLGSWTQKQLGRIHKQLPAVVQVGGGEGPGYLGAAYAPVPIGDPDKGLQNTASPKYLNNDQFDKRMKLSASFDSDFRAKAKNSKVNGYDDLYREAISLLRSEDLKVFDLAQESAEVRDSYGRNRLGQGALLARRLIEAGTRFVQVSHGSWDHHNDIFETNNMPTRAGELDVAAAALIKDLDKRGLLESTIVVIGTEFGRTPRISSSAGRDHHPAAFSGLLAGGAIKVGQAYGKSDADAFYVDDNGMQPGDLNATLAKALGIDWQSEIFSPDGRPFKIGNEGKPIDKLLS